MAEKAQVTSLDALESFRSHLIVYLSQARPAVEEVSAEVMRTRMWLEGDQRSHWENQMRRRMKVLEQAQEALFSSRLGALRHETAAEQMAVHRAKHAVEEADAKLRVLKKWKREFEGRVQPLVKQTEKLHTVFTNDMVKAVTFLTHALNTLAAYADAKPGPSSTAPSQTQTEGSHV
ncbi:MAG TPA: hypothetical protein VNZ64_04235 [Candidatus Acidoferrum sp.]|jgi:hypothetical protein|nr:hypothetical protein [Candidatus Acidoferrum sp.]